MNKPLADEIRLDELARRAGVPTTTVRLYQTKGLLPGPRLEGRTGFYGEAHLARLAVIGRLQAEGFSLAGIGKLLAAWDGGRGLDALVGAESQTDDEPVVLSPAELLAFFPAGTVTPDVVQRAATLGLVEARPDGQLVVPDRRFLEAGATLVRLGVPVATVLDEWAALAGATDAVAERFIAVFEHHLLPDDWRAGLSEERSAELAATLAELRRTARQILVAAFDASVAAAGARRLGQLTES